MRPTTYEWAEALTLPEDEKYSLIQNIIEQVHFGALTSSCNSFSVIDQSFYWCDTIEGHDFWESLDEIISEDEGNNIRVG